MPGNCASKKRRPLPADLLREEIESLPRSPVVAIADEGILKSVTQAYLDILSAARELTLQGVRPDGRAVAINVWSNASPPAGYGPAEVLKHSTAYSEGLRFTKHYLFSLQQERQMCNALQVDEDLRRSVEALKEYYRYMHNTVLKPLHRHFSDISPSERLNQEEQCRIITYLDKQEDRIRRIHSDVESIGKGLQPRYYQMQQERDAQHLEAADAQQ